VKGALIALLVVAVLIGGILSLRSTRSAGMPDKDVLDRARLRERDQAAKDDAESDR